MKAIAVTGTGVVGPAYVEALRRSGITVRGVLGSNPEKSRQAVQQLGLGVGYPDFQSHSGRSPGYGCPMLATLNIRSTLS